RTISFRVPWPIPTDTARTEKASDSSPEGSDRLAIARRGDRSGNSDIRASHSSRSKLPSTSEASYYDYDAGARHLSAARPDGTPDGRERESVSCVHRSRRAGTGWGYGWARRR